MVESLPQVLWQQLWVRIALGTRCESCGGARSPGWRALGSVTRSLKSVILGQTSYEYIANAGVQIVIQTDGRQMGSVTTDMTTGLQLGRVSGESVGLRRSTNLWCTPCGGTDSLLETRTCRATPYSAEPMMYLKSRVMRRRRPSE